MSVHLVGGGVPILSTEVREFLSSHHLANTVTVVDIHGCFLGHRAVALHPETTNSF